MTTFSVNNAKDSGAGSLRQAILDAGSSAGKDIIEIKLPRTTIELNSPLPTLETGNDIDFQNSSATTLTISGQSKHHIFTVNGANVSFSDLNLTQGLAKGGNGNEGGGGGLGAGGALTILSGSVTADSVNFTKNKVEGGTAVSYTGRGGDGYTFESGRDGATGGSGGGFNGVNQPNNGGNGGAGRSGASGLSGLPGGPGGFGAGGGAGGGGGGSGGSGVSNVGNGGNGRNGGAGGFGAGGGAGGGGGGGGGGNNTSGGALGEGGVGGDFAGNGSAGTRGENGGFFGGGSGGNGGLGGGGAGLGGAIFVSSGSLTLLDSTIEDNSATGGSGANNGQGKAGGIFVREGSVKGSTLKFELNNAANSEGNFTDYNVFQNNKDVYGTILRVSRVFGTVESDILPGNDDSDLIDAQAGNDTITAQKGDDTLTGGGGQDTFTFRSGDGVDTITDFGSVGTGTRPSQAVVAEVDTLKFVGSGLTAQNLLLTQEGNNLAISFEGVDETRVVLEDLAVENLDNLQKTTGAIADVGNILFDGQTTIADSFDVFDADWQRSQIFKRNSVTFLNDLDNSIKGFDRSDDVINAQAGDDTINGRSGNDLLRGEAGNDWLKGGRGDDTLQGGAGDDILTGGKGRDLFMLAAAEGTDTISDWGNKDKIGLAAGLSYGQLTVTQGTGSNIKDTLISVTDSSELLAILTGVQVNTISSSMFMPLA